jgi:acylphosphatase
MHRVHLIISGDVQGVGYRSWVLNEAKKRQLTGWVKNREDDAVELVAEGSKSDLENLIKACHKGPDVAWVEHVDVTWESATNEFVGFEVLY